jgi:hypothetical protein
MRSAPSKKGWLLGGTSWAVQLFIDRFERGTPIPCYVFDQVQEQWVQWDGHGFLEIYRPPTPTGIWTGIGTRDLLPSAKKVEEIFR